MTTRMLVRAIDSRFRGASARGGPRCRAAGDSGRPAGDETIAAARIRGTARGEDARRVSPLSRFRRRIGWALSRPSSATTLTAAPRRIAGGRRTHSSPQRPVTGRDPAARRRAGRTRVQRAAFLGDLAKEAVELVACRQRGVDVAPQRHRARAGRRAPPARPVPSDAPVRSCAPGLASVDGHAGHAREEYSVVAAATILGAGHRRQESLTVSGEHEPSPAAASGPSAARAPPGRRRRRADRAQLAWDEDARHSVRQQTGGQLRDGLDVGAVGAGRAFGTYRGSWCGKTLSPTRGRGSRRHASAPGAWRAGGHVRGSCCGRGAEGLDQAQRFLVPEAPRFGQRQGPADQDAARARPQGPAPTLAKRTRRPGLVPRPRGGGAATGCPTRRRTRHRGDRRRRTRARPPGGATSPTRRSPGPPAILRAPLNALAVASARANTGGNARNRGSIGPAARRRPAPPRPAWARSCIGDERDRRHPVPASGVLGSNDSATTSTPAPAWRGRPPRGWPRRPGCEGRSRRTRDPPGRSGSGRGGALGACSRKSRAPRAGRRRTDRWRPIRTASVRPGAAGVAASPSGGRRGRGRPIAAFDVCGICGVIQVGGRPRAVLPAEVLDRMTDAMTHRGPDDRGVHVSPRRRDRRAAPERRRRRGRPPALLRRVRPDLGGAERRDLQPRRPPARPRHARPSLHEPV